MHLSCIPFVCMTVKLKECLNQSVVEKLPSFVKLRSPFRKPIYQHIRLGLLFLVSLICPEYLQLEVLLGCEMPGMYTACI